MKKTNLDRYLEGQLCDPAFAARFACAGEAWNVAEYLSPYGGKAGAAQDGIVLACCQI